MLGYEAVPGLLDQSIAELKKFEGCVPWMYRDTAGKVTVGVGLMLPNAAAACALPFAAATGPATQEQITAEFARVNALPAGKVPGFYKTTTSLELPQQVIDAKLNEVLTEFQGILREKVQGYDKLPDVVQLVLLDMAYNLGPTGLLTEYPRMFDAIDSGAWAQAAAECERVGAGSARNAWAKQELLSAVVATIRAGMVAEIKAEAASLKEAQSAKTGLWSRVRRLLTGK